ncbi:MAG: DNRLRE domain-containing protein [Acidobacteria bacterium]|nr:DNRLRE domain-containing protein [Acidobacteriota bacterium]
MAHLRNQIFAILFSLSIFSASAATLVRGPYLQQGTDSGVIVRWRTDVATDGVVKYGLSSSNLNLTAPTGPSTTEHSVAVSGLAADTKYFYSIGSTTETLAGGDSTHFVVTSPTPGAVTPFRAWVLGDSGTKDANAAAVRDSYLTYAAGQDTNLWIMLGDNAYNDGTDPEYQQAVFDMYPQVLKNSVLLSTLGNHDGQSADSQVLPQTGSGPYYDIFEFPIAGEAGGVPTGTEAYYSFDRGNVPFVCLDSYHTDRSPSGAMMTWLESDLMVNDKPWLVAYWHHPPYTKGSHNSDTEGRLIDMRQNALPILEMYGVDLVLSGHSHSYERSYLIDGHYGISTTFSSANQINAGDGSESGDGVYQKLDAIAVPHAGAVFAVAGASGKISGGALNHPTMVVNLNLLGSMVLDFNDNRLDAIYLDSSGAVADEFTILKGADVTPPTLISVAAEGSATNVEVVFSEDVEQTSAETPGNYSSDGGITVSAATLDPDGHTVNLTTTSMTSGFTYTLTVNNVTDVALNPIALNSQQMFQYLDTITMEFQQGVDSYAGAGDTYLAEGAATTNFGSSTTLLVDGDDGLGVDLAPLLRFDISNIPAGSIVQSATVNLETFDPTTSVYSLYELKTAWSELGATWNESSSGVAWQVAGAQGTNDRGTAVLGTFSAPGTGNILVALNVDGVAAVQGWVDSPGSNHGIIIVDSTASNGGDIRSSEYGTASLRPKLTIVYSMPASDTDPADSTCESDCRRGRRNDRRLELERLDG